MQQLIRLKLMLKRTLRQPFFYIMAGVLIMLAAVDRFIPDSEKSASIPVAILCEDDSSSGKSAVEEILSMNSIYKYFTVSSSDEMYSEIASGRADSGFIIPKDYFSSCTSYNTQKDIRIITTDGSTFPSLAADEIYSILFKYCVIEILKDTIHSESIYKDIVNDAVSLEDISEMTVKAYNEILSEGGVFHIEDVYGGRYNEITATHSVEIPVRKLSGFFILAAALLGLLNYISDRESGIFIRMTGGEKLFMRIIEILVLMLPVSIISYASIIFADPGENAAGLLLHIILYSLAVCAFALILSLIIRKSTLMKGVLPVYLVLTLFFGGIFFDLSGFSSLVKVISGFFLPYYF